MSWTGIQTAIRAAVKTALGGAFTEDQVFFADQGGDREALPFCTIRIDGPRGTASTPSETEITDLGQAAGLEVLIEQTEHEEFSISIQVTTATVVGDVQALAYAATVRSALTLPTNRAAFSAAGFSVFDRTAVVSIPEALRTNKQGRATFTARCYTRGVASERTGYIASVTVTDNGPPERPLLIGS